jgi:hypothetical protein
LVVDLNVFYLERENNFPPLPKICPCRPCFYQDINIEIPNQFQLWVRYIYYLWLGMCLVFVFCQINFSTFSLFGCIVFEYDCCVILFWLVEYYFYVLKIFFLFIKWLIRMVHQHLVYHLSISSFLYRHRILVGFDQYIGHSG